MIAKETVEKIGSKVLEKDISEAMTSELRSQWPDIHFTFCSEDDISSGSPVYQQEKFALYLVDNSNHCISFTSQYENATGIVIAEFEEE